MPSRIIREGILTSPRMARLGWAEEVFYRRMMSVVDDFGRYYADHGLLRAACYPRQLNKVSDSDIGKWLQVIADAALVRVYPAQDGERYLQLLDFRQQTRAAKSKFPQEEPIRVADATQLPSEGEASAHLDVVVVVVEKEAIASLSPAVANDPIPIRLGCPQDRIRSLYAELLPSLPQARKWDSDRERSLRARWADQAKEKGWATADEGVEWFRRFFVAVSENDWAMGRSGRSKGHENWECDIDYLLTVKGFRRIIESAGRQRDTA